MIRPTILPDEIAGSYRGALARFNGFGHRSLIDQEGRVRALIDEWIGRGSSPIPEAPLARLAAVAGEGESHFRQHRTLGPLMFAVINPQRRSSVSNRLQKSLGNEATKRDLCLCSDCVAADLDSFGRSYWRREHQLPGVFWCAKHKKALRAVQATHAYMAAPSTLLESSQEYDYEWVRTLWNDANISRYLDVLSLFSDSTEPFTAPVVRDALRISARPKGYQVHPNQGRPVSTTKAILSHEAHTQFPVEWLRRTFETYRRPHPFKFQSWLDGTLWLPIPPTTSSGYALAAAMLFDSAEEFMTAVRAQQAIPENEPLRGPDTQKSHLPTVVRRDINTALRVPQATATAPAGQARRSWTVKAKVELVQRSYAPGLTVTAVAREGGITPNTLHRWRKLARQRPMDFAIDESKMVDSELAVLKAEVARLEHLVRRLQLENETLKRAVSMLET